MVKVIKFDKTGKNLVYVNKRKLKKDKEGYYLIHNGLIHYFDKNKSFQRSKFLIR